MDDGTYLIVSVSLRADSHAARLHPQVQVVRDQHDVSLGIGSPQRRRDGQDAVVRPRDVETGRQQISLLMVQFDAHRTAGGQLHPCDDVPFCRKLVHDADGLARVRPDPVEMSLEPVQFLDRDDRDDHLVPFAEHQEGLWIVQEDVGV